MRKLACLLLVVIALEGWAQSPVLQPDLQPDKDGVYAPGGDVKTPKLVHTAPAEFPADPRLNGMKYRCIVSTVIGIDGKPSNVRVEEAQTGPFGAAAMEAIEKSEFKPGTLYGSPVPVRVEIWVPFVEGEKRAVPEVMPLHLSFQTHDKNNQPPGFLHGREAQYSAEEGTVLLQMIVNEGGIPETFTFWGLWATGSTRKL